MVAIIVVPLQFLVEKKNVVCVQMHQFTSVHACMKNQEKQPG